MVVENRTSQIASEIVVAFRCARLTRLVSEPIVGVQHVVTEVLVDSTVQVVGSRARRQQDLSSWRTAKLRRKGRGFDAELPQSLHRHQAARSPECTEGLRRPRPRCTLTEHLLTAQAARAEAESASAEALRKATLALTQDLRMDAVLDTLLQTLSHIVPYDVASVILTEENERLFVAREAPPASANRPIVTLEVGDNALLQRVLVLKKGLHLADMREESEWRDHKALAGVRSWIAVPLVASDTVLGLFSIGSKLPRAFTTEHFRLAKPLAIPAAVAIHNARLYEWAQIYAAERQSLLRKIDDTPKTLQQNAESPRRGLPS